MHYLGTVTVKFKKSVLEPQGQAVMLSLRENGYRGVDLVRVGKSIEITVEAVSEDEARKQVQNIAEHILYNPVMETVTVEIAPL